MNGNTKNYIIKMLKIVIFTSLLIPVCLAIGDAYDESNKRNKVSEWNKRRFEDFYNTESNVVDMVFIGSSHSYCTFDPELIDQLLDVNSYQMGMPLQRADSSYYTLLEICKTQSPDTVVMEVYWDMLDDPFDLKQADSLFQVLRDKELQNDYIKNVFPLGEKVKYYLPIIRYQQDFLAEKNKELSAYIEESRDLKKEEDKQEGTEYYKGRGFIFCDYVITDAKKGRTNQFHSLDGKKWEFDPAQKKYLEKIVEYCGESDIRLIFVTAPVANASLDIIKNYPAINDRIAQFASEHNIPYLDFNMVNREERLFTNDNFRDDAHLNYSGVEIADVYFAEWMTLQ